MTSGRSGEARPGRPGVGADPERGSAVAEFVMVAALVLALFLAVVQVALAMHVRALAIDAAAEGARIAARADRDLSSGAVRTQELLASSLGQRYADDVSVRQATVDGLDVVEVTVRVPLPVVGLIGPSGVLTLQGHALEEA
ncbi:hypothetical protein GCM10009809_05160 [Isoptericola hypogeus]|uniref:TadE-like domain-containing protein n=1 Tax=Isoptericola hypogeus TaxID=300179 RepID=A0ABP4UX84_9MICO